MFMLGTIEAGRRADATASQRSMDPYPGVNGHDARFARAGASHSGTAPRDKQALVTAERSVSFSELDRIPSSLAAGLCDLGVAPGDRVTLYAPNSWEWIVSYYGLDGCC